MLRWMRYSWIFSRKLTAKKLPIDFHWIRNYWYPDLCPKLVKFLQGVEGTIGVPIPTLKTIIANDFHENVSHIANTVGLVTKQIIYRKRCQNEKPNITSIVKEIKSIYCKEKYIANMCGKTEKFNKKWRVRVKWAKTGRVQRTWTKVNAKTVGWLHNCRRLQITWLHSKVIAQRFKHNGSRKNAFKWAHQSFMKVFFAIIFSIYFEKLISSLRCVWPNYKIPINSNLLVYIYLAIIFSPSLKHRNKVKEMCMQNKN